MTFAIDRAMQRVGCAALLVSALSVGAAPPSLPLPSPAPGTLASVDATLRNASINVSQAPARPGEFPAAAGSQGKVAFECRIGLARPQMDFSRFPRLRCDIDRARTVALNRLTLARADSFFSGDGMTTRTVLLYEQAAPGTPSLKIRAAFQLYLDRSATDSRALLAEVVYADAAIIPSR